MSERKLRIYVVTARSDQSNDMLLLRAFADEREAHSFVRSAEYNELSDDGRTELMSHAEVLGLRLRVIPLPVEGSEQKV